jgi:hypothetical protein
MTLWSRLRSWFGAILRRSRMESEMEAELRFHVETYAEDLMRSGVPPEEALRRARLGFGGAERVKEECREARGVVFLESLLQDLRFGLRTLRKSPGGWDSDPCGKCVQVAPVKRPRRSCRKLAWSLGFACGGRLRVIVRVTRSALDSRAWQPL